MIEFKEVTKSFGERTILKGISLRIHEGHVTTIIGKSGTGKSVLLKHIIGLLTPDEGTILFRGKDIGQMSGVEWNEYTARISYMFQNNALFDSLTVFENIALPLRQTTNLGKKEIDRKVMARIVQAELVEAVHKYPSELSGGMQKRVALSRALVTDPQIVLFDEPTTGQDPIRRNAILSMVADYQARFGFTAVLISHDIPDVFFISNRIIVLYEGEIIFQGTPEELESLEHPFVDEFIESLEGFQEHLTGLYSRRNFKVRYHNALNRKHADETFVVAAFSMDYIDVLGYNLGHEMAQEVIQTLGVYINRHFGAVGGFSSRQSRDQFVTVLPFSDLDEADGILKDFAGDLNKQGLCDIQAAVQIPEDECFEFTVSAGLAEGQSGDEIESIIGLANSRRKTIGRFQCEIRREGLAQE